MTRRLRQCIVSLSTSLVIASLMLVSQPSLYAAVAVNDADETQLIKLGKPLQGRTEGEPAPSWGTLPKGVRGQVAYTLNIWSRLNGFHRSLIIEEIDSSQSNLPIRVTNYPLQNTDNDNSKDVRAFDPQFSPDGRYVILKVGDPWERTSAFCFYVLDLKTQKLRQLQKEAIYNRTALWSPDSKMVAYISGGDAEGQTYRKPIILKVHDFSKSKNYVIAPNPGHESLAWTPENTLLFAQYTIDQSQAAPTHKAKQRVENNLAGRFDIYEASVTGKPKLLIPRAYRPVVSSDGRKIAFWGPQDPRTSQSLGHAWWTNPNGMPLCVVGRDGRDRKALGGSNRDFSAVRWLPDNRHLLSIQIENPRDAPAEARISQWDTISGKSKAGTSFSSRDKASEVFQINTLSVEQFQDKALGRNTSMFVPIATYGRIVWDRFYSVKIVNLSTNEVFSLCEIKNTWGLDWLFLTTESTRMQIVNPNSSANKKQ